MQTMAVTLRYVGERFHHSLADMERAEASKSANIFDRLQPVRSRDLANIKRMECAELGMAIQVFRVYTDQRLGTMDMSVNRS